MIYDNFSEDTPLSEVKVGELPKWFARRNFSPTAMGRCASRAYWRWNHKFMQPRNAGIAGYVQVCSKSAKNNP